MLTIKVTSLSFSLHLQFTQYQIVLKLFLDDADSLWGCFLWFWYIQHFITPQISRNFSFVICLVYYSVLNLWQDCLRDNMITSIMQELIWENGPMLIIMKDIELSSTVVCLIHYIIYCNTLEWDMWAYNTNSNGNPV